MSEIVTDAHVRGAIEAILMVVDEPVAPADLAAALDVPEPSVVATLEALRDEFANPDSPRGFELRATDGEHHRLDEQQRPARW